MSNVTQQNSTGGFFNISIRDAKLLGLQCRDSFQMRHRKLLLWNVQLERRYVWTTSKWIGC